jgi:hydroxypyruvate reductase
MIEPTDFLKKLFSVAIERALPQYHLASFLPEPPSGRTVVVGAGKASAAMALAMQTCWPKDAPLSGLVVTRYGHVPNFNLEQLPRIEIMQAAHPVPDEMSVLAAKRMLALVLDLSQQDLVIALISGGGSSLLTLPCEGLTLLQKQKINQTLLNCGASIDQINCVRKHLSQIKGGRLARAAFPARVVTLCISDVPGDDPQTIASGPTLSDTSTCAQALEIINRYGIEIPELVRVRLQNADLETPKPVLNALKEDVRLMASAVDSLQAAAQWARLQGIEPYILGDDFQGESRFVAQFHASLAKGIARGLGGFKTPCVLLSGGETSVTLSGAQSHSAQGGRSTEFCLSLAQALEGSERVWGIGADTDGIDGVSSSAGAVITPSTLSRAKTLGLDIKVHLQEHNSFDFFHRLGDLVTTGPTFTNVNDFRALLIQ